MRSSSLILSTAISTFSLVFAQPDTLWTKTFGGSFADEGYSVQQTLDGGFIVTGSTFSFGNGDRDIWLVKTNANGEEEWTQTFGGSAADLGRSVLQSTDGGYILVGYTRSIGSGEQTVWLIKTDASGEEEWNHTLGPGSGASIQETFDGGYIITGSGDGVLLIKIDINGIEEWTQTIGSGWGNDVQQTADEGFIVTGTQYIDGQENLYLIKTQSNGEVEWSQVFGGAGGERGESVLQTSSGGYIILGKTSSLGNGGSDVWLIKTDSDGNEQWNYNYGGSDYDWGKSICQSPDGGYLLLGSTQSFGDGESSAWLVQTDSLGQEQWNYTIGGAGVDRGEAMQTTSDGGYIITGNTSSSGSGEWDLWLIMLVPPYDGPTWYVSGSGLDSNDGSSSSPFANIQTAINIASAGDTVLVAPGLYVGNVMLDSAITLGSFFLTTGDTSFISQTIVYGDSPGAVITKSQGDQSSSIGIFGLTIQNGFWGGIQMGTSSGNFVMDHLIVEGNQSTGVILSGGGIISNSTIQDNHSFGDGGGLALGTGPISVVNCKILNNHAGSEHNPGLAVGGGIYVGGSGDISIMKCLIKGNTADGDGGGIFIGYAEQMSLTNSIITNNLSISASGGGLHYNQSSLHIINSIIHNNSPLNISVWGDVLYNYPINFYNSIIEGGVESIVTTFPNGWVTIGSYSNCFDADPLFLNAEAGDYSVSDSSPAIDAGTALVTWGDTIYYTPQSNYEGFAPDIGLSETSQSLLHEPSNLEVIDVPGDQGGYIYLNWNRSFDDSEWLGNISVYSIWQRVPQTNLGRKVNSNTADLVTDSYKVLRDELWFNVATIPALQHETYSALLETFADSSESGINMTYLLITAHTTDPLIYYESQIDSGYSVNNEAVSISENYDVIPKQFYLNQNYPNPFNPTTTIQYGLPEDASVSLTIYDIQGNEIITIDSGLQSAGWYHHTWNGLDDYGQPVSTGLYLARLHAESYSKTIKMVYLK